MENINTILPVEKKRKVMQIIAYIILCLPFILCLIMTDDIIECAQDSWGGLCDLVLIPFIYFGIASLLISLILEVIHIHKQKKTGNALGRSEKIFFMISIFLLILVILAAVTANNNQW